MNPMLSGLGHVHKQMLSSTVPTAVCTAGAHIGEACHYGGCPDGDYCIYDYQNRFNDACCARSLP